ncbi:Nucleotidyl transferase AbiEii toxin, Type IV TA system [Selenomonas ruminantium]|uniref:Nucleotidyl transferase AbiEii toxin, Type IV TA system n=1 Tax=Selenomonas ruminantium TaxID=971 RepID=A0A1I3CQA1_SELRU|nr:nucleotidyl transferase AbiEii/AbiGii toxin family protein [Selenomonas ruminantium]SFH76702.1 Nucleotidyl transferase AbiEii toxin, Type IV TA system [Selenomonas ruminantium]
MDTLLNDYMKFYAPQTADDYRNALKEIVQEIALYGLSHSDFFQKAAFYGGTSLRIFYGLDRFSEDMDFSLAEPNADFSLEKYFSYVEEALASHGLEMSVSKKIKANQTDVQSAFIKGENIIQLITIWDKEERGFPGIAPHEVIKIKMKIDTNPPAGALYDIKYGLRPVPYMVRLYDEPSLFAGKLHAVLCRNWRNRVKGRDIYDFVWYITNRTKVNLFHLQKRLEQTGHWNKEDTLTIQDLRNMLAERFDSIDYEQAKQDVRSFIKEEEKLQLWGTDFFRALSSQVEAI